MRVVSVISTKGGVGKTTISAALAVKASSESNRVALVDLDPLGSLGDWWKRRGSTANPCIFRGADTASEAIEKLTLDGWDWVFIDTPPAFIATIEDAIENADLVVIPIRPSALDLLATEDGVAMACEARKDFLCVVNDAEPRWKTTQAAREYLLAADVPVAETIIAHRQAYLAAMTRGRTGPEIDISKDQKAVAEIDQLWAEVKARLNVKVLAKLPAQGGMR
jgi:chromosome partitioning protein